MKAKAMTGKARAEALLCATGGIDYGMSRITTDPATGTIWSRTNTGLGAHEGVELDLRIKGEGYMPAGLEYKAEILTSALIHAEEIHDKRETGVLAVTAAFKRGRERVQAAPFNERVPAVPELAPRVADACAAWGPGGLDTLIKVAKEAACADGFAFRVGVGGWRAATVRDGAMLFEVRLDPPEHLELGEAGEEGGFGEAELSFNICAYHSAAFITAAQAGGGGMELWSGGPTTEDARRTALRAELEQQAARVGKLDNPFIRGLMGARAQERGAPGPLKLDLIGRRVARAMVCGWRGLDGCAEGRMVNPPSHLPANVASYAETIWRVWDESETLDRRRMASVSTADLQWAAGKLREVARWYREYKIKGDSPRARVRLGGDASGVWLEPVPGASPDAPGLSRIELLGNAQDVTDGRTVTLDALYLADLFDALRVGGVGPRVDIYTVGALPSVAARAGLKNTDGWRHPIHFEPSSGPVRAVLMPTL